MVIKNINKTANTVSTLLINDEDDINRSRSKAFFPSIQTNQINSEMRAPCSSNNQCINQPNVPVSPPTTSVAHGVDNSGLILTNVHLTIGVDGNLQWIPAQAFIETGATRSFISTYWATQWNLPSTIGPAVEYTVANGKTGFSLLATMVNTTLNGIPCTWTRSFI